MLSCPVCGPVLEVDEVRRHVAGAQAIVQLRCIACRSTVEVL